MKTLFIASIGTVFCLLLPACGSFGLSKEQYLKRGIDFFDKGLYAEATINYRNALKKDPDFAEVYFRIGLVFLKQSKPADAFTNFEKAIELKPDYDDAKLAVARLCIDSLLRLPAAPKSLYDKLHQIAHSYLSADPQSFHGNQFLGYLAVIDSKPQEAAKHFQIAFDAKPASSETAVLLIQSLLQSGQIADAETTSLKAIHSAPTYGPLYDAIYFHYMSVNRIADGEALLLRKIAANPKESLYMVQLARHFRTSKQPQRMEETLAKLWGTEAYQDRYLTSGDFVRDIGDQRRALSLYENGITRDAANQTVYRKRIVSLLLQDNQAQEAIRILEDILRVDSSDIEARASRASLRIASGKPEEIDVAINEFTKLIDERPTATPYRYDLARALRSRGKDEEAKKHLLLILENETSFVPALEDLASISIQKGQAKEAAIYAERALALDPRNPRVRLVRSAAFALREQPEEARQELDNLVSEFPELREASMQLALLNIQEGRFREAEALYLRNYRPGQTDIRVLRGLVEAELALGKPERGLQVLQEELKQQLNSYDVRMLLGSTAARLNRSDLAIEQYLWLKQHSPASSQLEAALGLVYQQKNDWPTAINQFQTAHKLAPKDPGILAALAFALQRSGRLTEAIPLYRAALSIQPNYAIVKNNLAIALADSGGNLNEALQLVQSAIGQDTANASFADALGLILLKKKDPSSAVQSFRAAVSKDANTLTYRIHLAKALVASGDKLGARKELSTASAKNPSAEEAHEIAEIDRQTL